MGRHRRRPVRDVMWAEGPVSAGLASMGGMPSLSRWCVRAALVYLVAGMTIGSWMLIRQAQGSAVGRPWPTLHAHILLIGFLLLLVMGVAFWMFPRVKGQRPGRDIGWVSFGLFNAGLVLRIVAEPLSIDGDVVWRTVLGVAAVLPTLGALMFGIAILPRVRAAMNPAEARAMRAERGLPPRPD